MAIYATFLGKPRDGSMVDDSTVFPFVHINQDPGEDAW